MPLTVITLKCVPPALCGELTKWMQEIATGVYVGNYNTRIREELWNRVCRTVDAGEATLCYASRNEIGYQFSTINTRRKVIDYDGIPLVMIPKENKRYEFANAGDTLKSCDFEKSAPSGRETTEEKYIALDLETTGLKEDKDKIIEIGAVKIRDGEYRCFQCLVRCEGPIPEIITSLTGITKRMLLQQGIELRTALEQLRDFIGDCDLIGYNIGFDIRFLNSSLQRVGLPTIRNKTHDLMRIAKDEKMFLHDYKMQTVLKAYGIEKDVAHRALEDAKLVLELSEKVKKKF